jgi:hypothetical protein
MEGAVVGEANAILSTVVRFTTVKEGFFDV